MNAFIKLPYLQLPTPDGMTIQWQTQYPSASVVEVYRAWRPRCGTHVRNSAAYTTQGEALIFTGSAGEMHRVQITGLEPATDYIYRISAGNTNVDGETFENVFRTAPKPNAPISFCVTSETGGALSSMQLRGKLVDNLSRERPDFLLLPGDMVQLGWRERDWNEYLFEPFQHVFCHTPFYHCAGNHETNSDLMRRYLATSANGYYSFDYGCGHFVAIDTEKLSSHNMKSDGDCIIEPNEPLVPGNPQYDFLENDLKNSTAPWKIVYMHYPPYFSGLYEAAQLRPLCRLFEAYGVDMVIASHAIAYERSHPITEDALDFTNGVRYVVAGGAGAVPQWFDHKKAWHSAKIAAVPHYLYICLTPSHMEFQAISADGELFDSLTLNK